MRSIFLLISLIFSCVVSAGDYKLFITTENSKVCAGNQIPSHAQSCDSKASYVVCDANAVAKDIESYFKGKESQIGILYSSFANGRVVFCSAAAKSIISTSLHKIVNGGVYKRGRFINDFIAVNNL